MMQIRVHTTLHRALLLLLFLPLLHGYGQVPAGARPNGMAGSSLCINGPFAIFNNPATSAQNRSLQFGISHEQHYLLRGFSTGTIAFSWPGKFGAIGIGASQSGIPEMKRNMLSVSYAKGFSDQFFSGITLYYTWLTTPEAEKKFHAATFSAGFVFRTSPALEAAIYLFNPIPSAVPFTQVLMIPSVYRLGFLYRFNDRGFLTIETEKITSLPVSARIGVEYGLVDLAFIRSGIRINPLEWSFGTGLVFRGFYLDIAASLHPALGITPELSIMYKIRKNER